jgi:hypothetical protein
MKGVERAAMRAWMVGIMTGSVGPKIGAERRAMVGNVGWEEVRVRDSAMAWVMLRLLGKKRG